MTTSNNIAKAIETINATKAANRQQGLNSIIKSVAVQYGIRISDMFDYYWGKKTFEGRVNVSPAQSLRGIQYSEQIAAAQSMAEVSGMKVQYFLLGKKIVMNVIAAETAREFIAMFTENGRFDIAGCINVLAMTHSVVEASCLESVDANLVRNARTLESFITRHNAEIIAA